jgi:hypothetical protein
MARAHGGVGISTSELKLLDHGAFLVHGAEPELLEHGAASHLSLYSSAVARWGWRGQ